MIKMRHKIVGIILIIWFCVFSIDMISALSGSNPVFMLSGAGGCSTSYIGLGYSLTYAYGMTAQGSVSGEYMIDTPYIYLLVNAVILLWLLISYIHHRRK